MALRVLLGDAEVHVEEEERSFGRGFGALAVEHAPEPIDVDEAVVVREPLHRQGLVGGPGGEAGFVREDGLDPEGGKPGLEGAGIVRAVAVDDDRSAGLDALRVEEPPDLGVVDARQPRDREGNRARDVPAAGLGAEAPPVEGRG